MRRVLVIAAMDFEVRALLKALRAGAPVKRGAIIRGSAARDGMEFEVIAAGPGFKAARIALNAAASRPDAVVSAGICGALSADVKLYDVIAATAVNGTACEVPRSAKRFHRGALVSLDRVAASFEEKRDLAADGAVGVDMELAVVAEYGRSIRLPVFGIKSVSDVLDESFVLDFNAARDSEGRFRTGAIIAQALRQPWRGIPELARLKRRGDEASRRLGEFFADCDF